MKRLFGTAFAITIGTLALNCVTSGRNGGDGGGMMTDAHADTGACCTVAPQTFVTIAQGDINLSNSTSFPMPPVDVSQYRELVVGAELTGGTCYLQGGSVAFQEPNTSVFISTQGIGRVRVDGPTVRLTISTGNTGASCTGTAHYVIAGVSLN